MKPLMSPAYRAIEYVDSDDGKPFTQEILKRFDEEVHRELERHVEEDIPDELTQRFISLAADNRDQLEEFLLSPAHGPH